MIDQDTFTFTHLQNNVYIPSTPYMLLVENVNQETIDSYISTVTDNAYEEGKLDSPSRPMVSHPPPQHCLDCNTVLVKGNQVKGRCRTCYSNYWSNNMRKVIDCPSCGKSRLHYAHGICQLCYGKEKKKGKFGNLIICKSCKQLRPNQANSLCDVCYHKEKNIGNVGRVDNCEKCNELKPIYGLNLCRKCYQREYRRRERTKIECTICKEFKNPYAKSLCKQCYEKERRKLPEFKERKRIRANKRYHRPDVNRHYREKEYLKRYSSLMEKYGYDYCYICGSINHIEEHHLVYPDENQLVEQVLLCNVHHGMQPRKINSTPEKRRIVLDNTIRELWGI